LPGPGREPGEGLLWLCAWENSRIVPENSYPPNSLRENRIQHACIIRGQRFMVQKRKRGVIAITACIAKMQPRKPRYNQSLHLTKPPGTQRARPNPVHPLFCWGWRREWGGSAGELGRYYDKKFNSQMQTTLPPLKASRS